MSLLKFALGRQIEEIELAFIAFNKSAILGDNYHQTVHNLWNGIEAPLNAAKLDYEREFGKRRGGWLLDASGVPVNKN